MRILFANIGWMTHYSGQSTKDIIVGGGSYDFNDKHEVFNFLSMDGYYYGFVEPANKKTISLNRIDKNCGETELEDVLVVWVAKNKQIGSTTIVGWYKHATAYHQLQTFNSVLRNNYPFNFKAKEEDCVLLPIDDRTFPIPRHKKGFLGQSNVWYADSNDSDVQNFRQEVIDYIENYSSQSSHISRESVKVDSAARKKVEEAAVSVVKKEYEKHGYIVSSVEKDNLGWDLNARKGKLCLKLEVKGLAGSQISVHITRNEYEKMMDNSNKSIYRLCVVINAITNPSLIVFVWDEDSNEWVSDTNNNIKLTINLIPTYIAMVE